MQKPLIHFATAHDKFYETALAEIKAGKKRGHWMWYIFPQLRGLGNSTTSAHFGLENLEEATLFAAHPILGKNLREISKALLKLNTDDVVSIFGRPDNLKLQSSMTLFKYADENHNVYNEILKKFFNGYEDVVTKVLLDL